jgi:hypothetical protein
MHFTEAAIANLYQHVLSHHGNTGILTLISLFLADRNLTYCICPVSHFTETTLAILLNTLSFTTVAQKY